MEGFKELEKKMEGFTELEKCSLPINYPPQIPDFKVILTQEYQQFVNKR